MLNIFSTGTQHMCIFKDKSLQIFADFPSRHTAGELAPHQSFRHPLRFFPSVDHPYSNIRAKIGHQQPIWTLHLQVRLPAALRMGSERFMSPEKVRAKNSHQFIATFLIHLHIIQHDLTIVVLRLKVYIA